MNTEMKTLLHKAITLVVTAAMTVAILNAQEMNSLMFRRAVKSPEVTEQGITFRLRAPNARKVQISASWLGYNPENAEMHQGQDGTRLNILFSISSTEAAVTKTHGLPWDAHARSSTT